MIPRREFITLLGGGVAAWPLASSAQQGERMRRIGMLVGLPEGDPEGDKWVQAFLLGMSQLGWRRGTNFQLDLHWVATDFNRTQAIAKQLVESQPELIQVTSTPATAAIMRETQTIPVVFTTVSDPIGAGFVQTLTRPGKCNWLRKHRRLSWRKMGGSPQGGRAGYLSRCNDVQSENVPSDRILSRVFRGCGIVPCSGDLEVSRRGP